MYGYIYKTINMFNDKIYIGKHKGEFDENYKGSGRYLTNAINKYGKDNFIVELIEYCNDPEIQNEKEKYWISYFRDKGFSMYNISRGGDGGDTYYNLSPAARQIRIEKIRKNSSFNKTLPIESRLKGVATRRLRNNYIMSDSTKDKLRDSLHRYYQSDKFIEQREANRNRQRIYKEQFLQNWISEKHQCKQCGTIMTSYYGCGVYCCKSCAVTHKHTQETKDKIAEMNRLGICGNKGKHFSEEHRRKIGDGNRGKVRTAECRQKISAAKKGRPAWNKGLDISDPRVQKYANKREHKGPNKDRIGVTFGNIYRYIDPKELDMYLASGYVIGRKNKYAD